MNTSELTDADLQLAIAEILGWIKETIPPYRWKLPKGYYKHQLPNYPGDIAAALGLLTEKNWQYNINNGYVSIFPHTEQYWHNNTPKSIARAACKAWLNRKENDG